MALSSDSLVEILRAAGEPSRLRILALLAREELAVLELARILSQSQPRVSRHLRLLADASLIERFPDGAWVFYRLVPAGPGRPLLDEALRQVGEDDPALAGDAERLAGVRAERAAEAGRYFADNASRWDEIRSLYTAEAAVEQAVLQAAGPGPFRRHIDLGTGTGRMLVLLAPLAERSLGLDLSRQMLNIARTRAAEAGLARCELRHGDILATGLPAGEADLVTVHQVLHYLADPGAAIAEAARLLGPGGRLLIADFAPHAFEFLRSEHSHRRLGFAEAEMIGWMKAAGLQPLKRRTLPPKSPGGLTVKVWAAERAADRQSAQSLERAA